MLEPLPGDREPLGQTGQKMRVPRGSSVPKACLQKQRRPRPRLLCLECRALKVLGFNGEREQEGKIIGEELTSTLSTETEAKIEERPTSTGPLTSGDPDGPAMGEARDASSPPKRSVSSWLLTMLSASASGSSPASKGVSVPDVLGPTRVPGFACSTTVEEEKPDPSVEFIRLSRLDKTLLGLGIDGDTVNGDVACV